MAITNEQFDKLVRKLEAYSEKHPHMYELKLRMLAYLGYFYIFSLMFILIVLLIGSVVITLKHPYAIKFILILGVILFYIFANLKVKFEKPDGISVTKEDIPAFFKLCDEVSATLKSPKIKQVLITNEHNAAIVQFPKLGIFGWHENYLIIGLPLMQSLSPAEFKAVLAHEFAHLSHAHGKFGNWIYRVRKTWNQMMDSFADSLLFKHFFNWYAPYFWAYSFVYARANEYEADRSAARAVGAANMGNALMRLDISGDYLYKKFWPGIYEHADNVPEPAIRAFAEMHLKAKEFDVAIEQQEEWLQKALKRETGTEDTHPSLSDRLKSLKISPNLPQKVVNTSAEQYLGNYLPKLQKELDDQWQQNISESWKNRYEYVQKTKKEMAEYEAKKEKQKAVTIDESYRYAKCIEEFKGKDEALPLYENVLTENPQHVSAMERVGNLLLEKKDDRGIELIEKVMELDKDYIFDGTKILYYYLVDKGEKEKAQKYYDQANQWSLVVDKAQYERADMRAGDEYIAHGLDKETLSKFQEELRKYPFVTEAYLVRKKVKHIPEKPLYVLGVNIKLSGSEKKAEKKRITLKEQIGMAFAGVSEKDMIFANKRSDLAQNLEMPGEGLIFVANSAYRKKMVLLENKDRMKKKYGLMGNVGALFYGLRYGWPFTHAPDAVAQPQNLIYTRTGKK